MRYPTGNNANEQYFLDNLRGTHFSPEDWERLIHTYRTIGGRMAREQVKAEVQLCWIEKKLKEAELHG